jgi:hypothetical protein
MMGIFAPYYKRISAHAESSGGAELLNFSFRAFLQSARYASGWP